MKKMLLSLLLAAGVAAPANATGGLVCSTAGTDPVEVTVGFGHTPGSR